MSIAQNHLINSLASVRDEINKILRINRGIKSIVISLNDGTPVLSSTNDLRVASLLAAVATALQNIAVRAGNLTNSGELKKIIAHYIRDKIIVVSANNNYNILIRASSDAPLGIILRDIMILVNKIKEINM
ncbi:MAG: roadblock/LC7 domain-containing protein [Candidatus Njordarchaeales archaeon]